MDDLKLPKECVIYEQRPDRPPCAAPYPFQEFSTRKIHYCSFVSSYLNMFFFGHLWAPANPGAKDRNPIKTINDMMMVMMMMMMMRMTTIMLMTIAYFPRCLASFGPDVIHILGLVASITCSQNVATGFPSPWGELADARAQEARMTRMVQEARATLDVLRLRVICSLETLGQRRHRLGCGLWDALKISVVCSVYDFLWGSICS